MISVLQTIRLLVIIQLIKSTRCQNGFTEQDILRYQQMASNDGQVEANTGFNNILQRDQNSQSLSSPVSIQYNTNDDTNKNNNYGRTFYSRSRKIYRIKNPFQQQIEETEKQPEITESQDSGAGASNQYASVQYSLPPEEFLQQLRAENQYYQQTQMSTPAPSLGYTATPLPQYQYSTVSPSNYDNNNQQNNQIPLEPKASHGQSYLSSPSPYQYSTPNSYLDSVQSTASPLPSYLSTPLNNGQYSGTQSSSYVSSSSPIYLSSPSNLQSYVSSPLSVIQTGSPDYSNRVTTTIGNNVVSYDSNDQNKKMQIDHYDYAGNGVRYPNNIQQQYQNDYSSSTTTTTLPYQDQLRETWQNAMNSNINAASKSLQESQHNQYQNYQYQNSQQDSRLDSNSDNSDTHRIGSMTSANNLFVNYVQPDNQMLNNLKIRTRDLEHETGQADLYSNGDFGWKLTGKKPLIEYSSGYPPRYSQLSMHSDGPAVSQMNFHMETGKPYNYDQVSKTGTEAIEAQEFAKAAAKAHERFKQQQQQQQHQQQQQQQQQLYGNNNNYGSSNVGNSDIHNAGGYYGNNDKQKNKYTDNSNNPYLYSTQNDLITASPYFLSTPRENLDGKSKQPFDHDKALKNIVPIDVSNVVANSDPSKSGTSLDNNGRFTSNNYGKDQLDQNIRQYIRPVTDSFYKDKNTIYGFNIKTKSDDYLTSDNLKQIESTFYGKQPQSPESSFNQGSYSGSQGLGSYLSQQSNNYQDNMQSQSTQQSGYNRNQNQLPSDIASILKFNDIPYKLTQSMSNDALKLHNINFDQGSIPTPLPLRINQNVGSHQIDVTTSLLNKLLLNKQPTMNMNRPEIDSSLLSTINGFKVANPFNVDLKLVADMLKGKPTIDDTQMMTLRDQYSKPAPMKFDLSQLQFLLKNENTGNLAPINDGLSALGGSYMDIYNNGRFPYQGVKYSRSQEEEESIVPIADASSTHPIGAVIEQDDSASEREVSSASELTGQGDDVISSNFEDSRPKSRFMSGSRSINERHRHPNLLLSGRHSYQRKYPKSDVDEPYPLLKPPPPHSPMGRGSHMKLEKYSRRRRVNKPKLLRIMKTEPLFEAGAETESLESSVPIVLRPPPPVAESKSDTIGADATT